MKIRNDEYIMSLLQVFVLRLLKAQSKGVTFHVLNLMTPLNLPQFLTAVTYITSLWRIENAARAAKRTYTDDVLNSDVKYVNATRNCGSLRGRHIRYIKVSIVPLICGYVYSVSVACLLRVFCLFPKNMFTCKYLYLCQDVFRKAQETSVPLTLKKRILSWY